MATMDLVRKLQELKEKGWDLQDVIFLLEDEYIEIQADEIDKMKSEVIKFIKSVMTQRAWHEGGYRYLCYIIASLIKEKKSYWEAVEEAAMKFSCKESDIRGAMRWTISQMEFDADTLYFDGINFSPEYNQNLDKEFIEEAVDYIGCRIE